MLRKLCINSCGYKKTSAEEPTQQPAQLPSAPSGGEQVALIEPTEQTVTVNDGT